MYAPPDAGSANISVGAVSEIGATGVTELDATEGTEVPALLMALTVKV
jgi:hypothetical protein